MLSKFLSDSLLITNPCFSGHSWVGLGYILSYIHVRAQKATTSSQSIGEGSSFFSLQSKIEQLKETLRQRDEEQRQRDKFQRVQYEAMRQRDDHYAQAFAQQQLIL
jgi:hypothetical protein